MESYGAFESFELQVSGPYDAGAQLYRWAEMAGRDLDQHQGESDLEAYCEALMESMLRVSAIVCPLTFEGELCAIFLP